MNEFSLKVLSATNPFYDNNAQSLVIPTLDGQYGIQAHHRNTITAIVPGKLKIIDSEGKEIQAIVSSGLVKIEDNTVLVLVETCDYADEYEENRRKEIEEELKEQELQKQSLKEYSVAQARISRMMSKLSGKDDENK